MSSWLVKVSPSNYFGLSTCNHRQTRLSLLFTNFVCYYQPGLVLMHMVEVLFGPSSRTVFQPSLRRCTTFSTYSWFLNMSVRTLVSLTQTNPTGQQRRTARGLLVSFRHLVLRARSLFVDGNVFPHIYICICCFVLSCELCLAEDLYEHYWIFL